MFVCLSVCIILWYWATQKKKKSVGQIDPEPDTQSCPFERVRSRSRSRCHCVEPSAFFFLESRKTSKEFVAMTQTKKMLTCRCFLSRWPRIRVSRVSSHYPLPSSCCPVLIFWVCLLFDKKDLIFHSLPFYFSTEFRVGKVGTAFIEPILEPAFKSVGYSKF